MLDHSNTVSEEIKSNWTDLPGAFLCHILRFIPNKRAEVKSVCSTWRAAINSSLNQIRMPAADLPLLQQLPNIKQLAVFGTAAKLNQQQGTRHNPCTWPPRLFSDSTVASAAALPAAAADGVGSESQEMCNASRGHAGQVNCWGAVDPQLLNRLNTLQLLHCPKLAQHLAIGLWQPTFTAEMCASSSCCSSWAAPLPAFTALKRLEINAVGNVSSLLAALREHRAVSAPSQPGSGGGRSLAQAPGLALEQLQELHLVDCCLDDCYRGLTTDAQLHLLSELPRLHTLQLSGCGWLHEVPAPVTHCGGLTRLLLCNNDFLLELPAEITKLTALQVLNMSGNSMLRSLGPSFSKLISLTELSLSGPSRLWADHSTAGGSSKQHAQSTAASGPSTLPLSAQLCRAALPQLLLPPLPHQQQHQLLRDLASLQQLRRLILSCNRQLMVLPAMIAALTGLTHLDLRGCGLRWLGEDVLECASLQELLLSDNVLAELPDEISKLQELRVLEMAGCSSLWRLPSSLLRLPKLLRVLVPSKAIGQHVLEQLECRQESVQVDMEAADAEACGWTTDAEEECYTDSSEESNDLDSGGLSSNDDSNL